MRFEHTQVFNFEGALRGMRNPLESWDRSDSSVQPLSGYGCIKWFENTTEFVIGPNDINLAQRLISGGSEHRKFLRQIFVSVDITAPLFWYKEFDTYKVGTVANSTSTMHKIMSKPFTMDMFEIDDFVYTVEGEWFEEIIERCNSYRDQYIIQKEANPELAKQIWKALIRILPESWLQTRTVTMNYEVIRNIVHQRANHKLSEWHKFIDWAHTLPYAEELIFFDGEKDGEKDV